MGIVQIVAIIGLVVGGLIFAQAPTEQEALANSGIELGGSSLTPVPLVSTVQPTPSTNKITISATGAIIVRNIVDLVPQTTGRVVWVSDALRRGGYFNADEKLVQVERSDFELALARAEAETQVAQSNYDLTLATSEAAIQNYAILNPDVPVPPLVAKMPQLKQAKAQTAAAQSRADIAQLDLARTSFALPFQGRVVASTAEVGQLLKSGQKFGEVFATDSIEARVQISPRDLEVLNPAVGRKALITVSAQQFQGEVVRVAPEFETRTRFAQLYLSIDTDAILLPGSFIEVEIEGPAIEDTILLPDAAEQIGESVWSVSNGKLIKQQPTFLNRNRKGILARAFDVGDGVVLGTVPGAFEGMAVETEVEVEVEPNTQ